MDSIIEIGKYDSIFCIFVRCIMYTLYITFIKYLQLKVNDFSWEIYFQFKLSAGGDTTLKVVLVCRQVKKNEGAGWEKDGLSKEGMKMYMFAYKWGREISKGYDLKRGILPFFSSSPICIEKTLVDYSNLYCYDIYVIGI